VTSLTVRNLPEGAKQRFRQVAAAHGRSMEEHLRQLIIEADFTESSPTVAALSDNRRSFRHADAEPVPTAEEWVRELINRASDLGEGFLDLGKYADIRYLSAKDALTELRRLANGVGLDLPPRLNTRREAPEF
jgi:plasmid stability protein